MNEAREGGSRKRRALRGSHLLTLRLQGLELRVDVRLSNLDVSCLLLQLTTVSLEMHHLRLQARLLRGVELHLSVRTSRGQLRSP